METYKGHLGKVNQNAMSDKTFMDLKASTSSLLESATSTGGVAPTRVQRDMETDILQNIRTHT